MEWALNLGCGDKPLDSISGYKCINIDLRKLYKINVVGNVLSLPFKDASFDRILASDILEHFPISKTTLLLIEWARVLKPGGRLKIRTPSLRWVVDHYSRTTDAQFVSYHIFGGQDYPENFHYVIFDKKWLSSMCANHGLRTIDHKEIHSNFEIVVIKEE